MRAFGAYITGAPKVIAHKRPRLLLLPVAPINSRRSFVRSFVHRDAFMQLSVLLVRCGVTRRRDADRDRWLAISRRSRHLSGPSRSLALPATSSSTLTADDNP